MFVVKDSLGLRCSSYFVKDGGQPYFACQPGVLYGLTPNFWWDKVGGQFFRKEISVAQKKKKIIIVCGSDWTGMYVDGEMRLQSHSLSAYHVLQMLGYDVETRDVSSDTEAEKWLETRGGFPETLEEYDGVFGRDGQPSVKPCTCPRECDCQNPPPDDKDGENGTYGISNSCPVHNTDPDPDPTCPLHGWE